MLQKRTFCGKKRKKLLAKSSQTYYRLSSQATHKPIIITAICSQYDTLAWNDCQINARYVIIFCEMS